MLRWMTAVALALALAGQARAQTTETSSAGPDMEALREQLRREIKASLKDELRRELADELRDELQQGAETEGFAPVESQDWAEGDWSWEEPTEPQLNFLEFDGYFRLRWDLWNNLDLNTFFVNGTGDDADVFGPFPEPFVFQREREDGPLIGPGSLAPPVPVCVTDFAEEGCRQQRLDDDLDTLAAANMRLRLEPTLNVYEDIKIKSQIDVLDNIVLGSTPDALPFNPITPLAVLSNTQVSPSDGTNSVFTDAIRVKRLWGEVMTPLGQIRFGRQPNHFGMGVLVHDGEDIDNDFGDSVDRITFSAKFGDFYIMPAYDWLATGPLSRTFYEPAGQPLDRGERDDVEQWVIRVVKEESAEVIEQKLAKDAVVWNVGGYGAYRRQAYDVPDFYRLALGDANTNSALAEQATLSRVVERDAEVGMGSFYAKLMWRKLIVEAEYAFILGSIGNRIESRGEEDFNVGEDLPGLDLTQHGGALKAQYKLLKDALTLEFLFAFATGDRSAGWGVRPFLGDGERRIGSVWDGFQGGNDSITNFRFNPAFNFDMILWRQLVGTLTDGLVFRPSAQYNLTEELGARLDVIYSRAMFASSTPSGSLAVPLQGGADLGSPDANLGVEFNLKVFFDSDDGFHTWFQYGALVAMDGLDRLVQDDDATGEGAGTVDGSTQAVRRLDAGVAHTLQLFLGITF